MSFLIWGMALLFLGVGVWQVVRALQARHAERSGQGQWTLEQAELVTVFGGFQTEPDHPLGAKPQIQVAQGPEGWGVRCDPSVELRLHSSHRTVGLGRQLLPLAEVPGAKNDPAWREAALRPRTVEHAALVQALERSVHARLGVRDAQVSVQVLRRGHQVIELQWPQATAPRSQWLAGAVLGTVLVVFSLGMALLWG